jgi:cysteine desulfurase
MPNPVYLDYNATTPMDPRVLEAMIPWLLTPSNAGSRTHSFGQAARDAVEKARKQVADVLAAKPEEIYFTSGATESNNLAILGLTKHGEKTVRKHILSTAIEHKAILEPLDVMRQLGFDVEFAPVTCGGYVEPDEIKKRLRPDTLLVSVMHANNETGVLQPIHEIGEMLANTDVLFHTDAAQTFGKEERLRDALFDFASVSGHKLYGPQGIGALCIRRKKFLKPPLSPLLVGGGQERGLRPGTVPVAAIVGFGAAAVLAACELHHRREVAEENRRKIISMLENMEYQINGDPTRTQSHVLNISFPNIDSEALMLALRNEVATSNGSACTTAVYKPSHVLTEMGLDEARVSSSVRLSWGNSELQLPVDAIRQAILSLRDTGRN